MAANLRVSSRYSRSRCQLAACLLALAALPAQAGELLRLAQCGSEHALIQVSPSGQIRSPRGPSRALSTPEIGELLALVREGTGQMDQQWISAAADSRSAGRSFTDRTCLELRLNTAGASEAVRWPLVPEPWNLASLKLHRLEQTLFGLGEQG